MKSNQSVVTSVLYEGITVFRNMYSKSKASTHNVQFVLQRILEIRLFLFK